MPLGKGYTVEGQVTGGEVRLSLHSFKHPDLI